MRKIGYMIRSSLGVFIFCTGGEACRVGVSSSNKTDQNNALQVQESVSYTPKTKCYKYEQSSRYGKSTLCNRTLSISKARSCMSI